MEPDYTKTTLGNGLTVMLKEIHTAPLASVWMRYKVGSRYETPGITGASHWVEHMQFKGTSQFPSGVLEKAISRLGGYWNAMTYLDWTTYLATMPASKRVFPVVLAPHHHHCVLSASDYCRDVVDLKCVNPSS